MNIQGVYSALRRLESNDPWLRFGVRLAALVVLTYDLFIVLVAANRYLRHGSMNGAFHDAAVYYFRVVIPATLVSLVVIPIGLARRYLMSHSQNSN